MIQPTDFENQLEPRPDPLHPVVGDPPAVSHGSRRGKLLVAGLGLEQLFQGDSPPSLRIALADLLALGEPTSQQKLDAVYFWYLACTHTRSRRIEREGVRTFLSHLESQAKGRWSEDGLTRQMYFSSADLLVLDAIFLNLPNCMPGPSPAMAAIIAKFG